MIDLNRLRTEDFPRDYIEDFMQPFDPDGPIPRTQEYVVSPPALWIRDSDGSVFTLGFDHPRGHPHPGGEFEYDVVWNGAKTGQFACRIERRGGRVRIFGSAGWQTWSSRAKTFI